MVPTARLCILAVLCSVALFAYPGGDLGSVWVDLAVLNGILVASAVIDALCAPPVSGIALRREHPPVVVMGTTAELRWAIANRGRRPVRLGLADELAPSLGARTRRSFLRLAPQASATVKTTISPSRRGRFELSHMVVRLTGPLGLGMRQRRVEVPSLLRVHPPFRSRDEAELRIRKGQILEVGMRSARGFGAGTEFEMLREYGPDDEFRRVDWAATARTGKPIVRVYRPERNQTVIVLLDNGRLMAGQVDDVPRIEHTMDATIMLCAVATRLGDRFGLVTFDQQVRTIVPPSRHANQLSRVIEGMYALEPALSESDYVGAFRATITRFRRRSMLVILSDLSAQAVSESLIPALPLILRSHLVVVGAVRDPDIGRWAGEVPRDAADAYRKAAATSSLTDRQRVSARLRGMGVIVVDAPPGKLAPMLADAYLEAKSTGRL